MTLAEKIKNLNWVNLINKLKDILKELAGQGGGGDPRPYKVYTALLTQEGTDAPVATVLENTLGGDIVWSRFDQGYYDGTLTGAFTESKTVIFFGHKNDTSKYDSLYITNNKLDVNSFEIITTVSTISSPPIDDAMLNTPIEIRVYN
jgi:hypothetical protein